MSKTKMRVMWVTPALLALVGASLAGCAAEDLGSEASEASEPDVQQTIWSVTPVSTNVSPAAPLRLHVEYRSDKPATLELSLSLIDSVRGLRVLERQVQRDLAGRASFDVVLPTGTDGLDLRAADGPVALAITGHVRNVSLDVPVDLRLEPPARGGASWQVRSASEMDPVIALATPSGPSAGGAGARAAGIRVCFKQISLFADGGIGEDNWASSTAQTHEAIGARVTITPAAGGAAIFDGNLDDEDGCTPTLSASAGSYTSKLFSYARVHGNTIFVVADVDGTGLFLTDTRHLALGDNSITLDAHASHRLNVAAATAYIIHRRWAGMTGKTFNIRTNTLSSSGSHYERAVNTVHIATGHFDNKFVIAHEVGHMVADLATGDRNVKLVDLPCGETPAGGADCTTVAGHDHSMTGKERSKCAAGEGFAHFYSAAVWNSASQTDCFFHYYKNEFGDDANPIVNCESGNGKFVVKYMENKCTGPDDGYGVELDWLRAFWDVHSNGADAPEFAAIMDWLDRADDWGASDVVDKLDDAANSVGGRLKTNWIAARDGNGLH